MMVEREWCTGKFSSENNYTATVSFLHLWHFRHIQEVHLGQKFTICVLCWAEYLNKIIFHDDFKYGLIKRHICYYSHKSICMKHWRLVSGAEEAFVPFVTTSFIWNQTKSIHIALGCLTQYEFFMRSGCLIFRSGKLNHCIRNREAHTSLYESLTHSLTSWQTAHSLTFSDWQHSQYDIIGYVITFLNHWTQYIYIYLYIGPSTAFRFVERHPHGSPVVKIFIYLHNASRS